MKGNVAAGLASFPSLLFDHIVISSTVPVEYPPLHEWLDGPWIFNVLKLKPANSMWRKQYGSKRAISTVKRRMHVGSSEGTVLDPNQM